MLSFDPMRSGVPILKRLLPSLRKRWARLAWRGGYAVVRRRGAYFLLDYRNFVDRQLAFFGHEAPQLDYLLDRMATARADLFIDIGANFGLYSVLAAGTATASRVIAVEPDRRSLAQLAANLLLNGLVDRVEVIGKAASARSGAVPFHFAASTSTGQSRVAEEPGAASVEAIRLDDLVPDAGRTIFVKIDVEGHECEVIAGMAALLARNRVFLQIECFAPNLGRLTEDLTSRGFTPRHRIADDHYFANFSA